MRTSERGDIRPPLQGPVFELPQVMSDLAVDEYTTAKQIELDPALRPQRGVDGFSLGNIGGGQIDLAGDLGHIIIGRGVPMSALT